MTRKWTSFFTFDNCLDAVFIQPAIWAENKSVIMDSFYGGNNADEVSTIQFCISIKNDSSIQAVNCLKWKKISDTRYSYVDNKNKIKPNRKQNVLVYWIFIYL